VGAEESTNSTNHHHHSKILVVESEFERRDVQEVGNFYSGEVGQTGRRVLTGDGGRQRGERSPR